MKEKLHKEYTTKIRKVLNSKLNGLNTFTAIYSRAFVVISDSAGVVHWRKYVLLELYYKEVIDNVKIKRGEEFNQYGRCSDTEINNLRKHLSDSEDALLNEARIG